MEKEEAEALPDLEILFAVRKSKNEFYSREKVRRALDDKKLAAELGLRVIGVQVFSILIFYDHLKVSKFHVFTNGKNLNTFCFEEV
jgi:hypothetical protein